MSGFDSRITHIGPSWPVRPVQPGKRDRDRNDPKQTPRPELPPGNEDADDDSKPTIDEHV